MSERLALDAEAVKHRLYSRHHANANQMPGPWTVIEEWRGIDVLAFAAWSSIKATDGGAYARIGYEVKVSRSDMRSELLRPHKREHNVEWCNQFYFAVPKGLLTGEELAFEEPEWDESDWRGEPCPGFAGARCLPLSRRKKHFVRIARPTTEKYATHDHIVCPTCGGKGVLTRSRVEREAPTLWIPKDVGLVVVDGRGTRIAKRAPRRKDVPPLSPGELGQLVRWISIRPDPRHAARRAARKELAP